MREDKTLYTMKEIELATGIKAGTLHGRRRRLGISSNRGGYTLAEVKQLIKRPPLHRGVSRQKIEALRAQLKNDGAL